MLTRYAFPVLLAAAVSACSVGPVDKVCTVNVKTEKAINGRELRPETEAKTMVLTINEGSKLVRFNGQLFTATKDASFYDGMVYGDKKSNSSSGPMQYETALSLKYHIATGVIDYVETNRILQTVSKHYEYEQISYNGTCK